MTGGLGYVVELSERVQVHCKGTASVLQVYCKCTCIFPYCFLLVGELCLLQRKFFSFQFLRCVFAFVKSDEISILNEMKCRKERREVKSDEEELAMRRNARRGRSDEEEGATRRKERRGGRSDEEEGA